GTLSMNSRNAEIICFLGPRGRTDLFVLMVQVRNEDNTLCTMLLRVYRFVDERRMPREIRAFERTVRIRFLRFMTQYDDDLSVCTNAFIIVVMQLWGSDAVTHEDECTIEACGVREGDGYEILINFELVPVELQLIIRSKDGTGCQLKFLKIGVVVTHRTKTESPELRRNVIRRLIQFG